MSLPATAKVCIKCGTDCSGKPRTKDAQGRYTCKACFDAMTQKAAAPKPAARVAPKPVPVADAADDAAVMAALLESAPPALTETCPSCGNGMAGGTVICTICGYNKETGKAVGVKVLKAPKEKRAGGPRISLSMSPMMTFLICLGVFGAPAVLLISAPDLLLPAQAVSALFGLCVGVWTLVQGFRTAVVTGVILLVTALIPLVNLYWLYFVFSVNDNGHLKAAWGASLISGVVMVFLVMSRAS